ncbi:MAG: N-acetylmuramoyl-L-alanine amidase [Chloroflexota bacterium]|nr:N-acetylmuramoyl-L-alanine amidase [Chloroflexota bacterium]
MGTTETEVTAAPAPFTYLMLRWRATARDEQAVHLEVRASADGQTWTEWGEVHENEDLIDPAADPEVHWSGAIYTGPASFWQVRVTLRAAEDGSTPVLHEVQVHTVDARGDQPAPAAPAPAALSGGVTRPGFVSRAAWGGSEVLNNSNGPSWYPANHLVVHHTADPNSLRSKETNWADRVRAIWSFHTYSRGWGDVGYNWLVDPNGVIYEGRNGSSDLDRDAVGIHDTANKGSMGVAMLGTFQSDIAGAIVPPDAAQNSVVALLAWKASQRGIDPMGSSYYYGCSLSNACAPHNPGAVVANIAGHRQVTPGHTSCPGDLAMGVLDSIRARVRDALGSATDNGDTVVDELEAGAERSSNSWHADACGFSGHTYWTYATDGAAENWVRWRANLPQDGRYHLYAARPQGCDSTAGQGVTSQARYYIEHANGSETVVRSQNVGEDWIDLGAYWFSAGTGGSVYLDDATGESLSSRRVIYVDAMMWVLEPEGAPPPPQEPPPSLQPPLQDYPHKVYFPVIHN